MIGLHGGVYKPPPIGGAIAQLGERLNGIQEVVGSIPIGSTIAERGDQSGTDRSSAMISRSNSILPVGHPAPDADMAT